MLSTCIIYGSTTGDTREMAYRLRARFPQAEMKDVRNMDDSDFEKYDLILAGTSTWQESADKGWIDFICRSASLDLSQKTVALFGTGDQFHFRGSFGNGIGDLRTFFLNRGATLIGHWPTVGYRYSASRAEYNGQFSGLLLDEYSQPDKTSNRIRLWAAQIKKEYQQLHGNTAVNTNFTFITGWLKDKLVFSG